ncbi:hypothetical protein RRG08_042831 [Elysia crispata]|uniref:Uncharacterized protein n=1 Tax=Elysia crispata TaxID=231223 RepID=A0AAE1DWA5_9GAST|nr:hypothetical protein RRG08_042831 [Elysia crispata]
MLKGVLQKRAAQRHTLLLPQMPEPTWTVPCVSTKEKPEHDNCPPGEESWCWYERVLQEGPVYPTLHDREQSTYLYANVAKHIQKVYMCLNDPALLGQFVSTGSLGSRLFFPAVRCMLTSAVTSLGHKRTRQGLEKK